MCQSSGAYVCVSKARTGDLFPAIVRVVLGLHPAFAAIAEFPDVYTIGGAVLSLAIPVLFLPGEAGKADILDERIYPNKH